MTVTKYLAIVGGSVAIIAFLAHGPSRGDQLAMRRAYFAAYASVLTGDTERERCIIDSGPRLSATRADYVSMAAAVCDSAKQVSDEQARNRKLY